MDFENASLVELRALAKEKGMKGYSTLKKQELAEALKASQGAAEAPAREEKPVRQETRPTPGVAPMGNRPQATERPRQMNRQYPAGERMSRPMERPMERPGQSYDGRPQNRPQGRPQQGYPRQGQSFDGRPGQNYDRQGQSYDGRPQNRPQQSYVDRSNDARSQQGASILYDSRVPRQSFEQEQRQQFEQYEQHQDTVQPTPRPASDGRIVATKRITTEERTALDPTLSPEIEQLDSGETKSGILEVIPDGYGFIRCDNFLPGENDVYVSPAQIRKFNLKTGDIVVGNTKVRSATEKFSALLYVKSVNGFHPSEAAKRPKFEDLTPIFPNIRLRMETPQCGLAMRIVDLLSPIGKGQRGMIVSQPKAGKTTLLKQIATSITTRYPEMHVIILLIDERPEEVTDMKESITGDNVEVIYSTFDELPENHKRVSEMVIERAKRLVEHKQDVVILLDSITRLARAYNLTCQASGRTLSGGLDPAALHMPKKFFGAARNMREGGSLTVIATALVETGSRMDDVVFEEFKGTGNMELVLNRGLSERRIFPAIDLPKSSTRREDLLLTQDEVDANIIIRRAFNSAKSDEAVEKIINLFAKTKNNAEFVEIVKKTKLQ